MANVILVDIENIKNRAVVFHDLPVETAKTIADHMNTLNASIAKKTGKAIKTVFRVLGGNNG